jgi:nitrite reductase/ring-hydroxylating ferredoxin subunit
MAWHKVFETRLLKEDEVVGVKIVDEDVALYRVGGRVYATHNVCTHGEALLSEGWVDDGCIECPLHQGRFEIATGKGQGSPISVDLKTYAVKEDSGWIHVEVS